MIAITAWGELRVRSCAAAAAASEGGLLQLPASAPGWTVKPVRTAHGKGEKLECHQRLRTRRRRAVDGPLIDEFDGVAKLRSATTEMHFRASGRLPTRDDLRERMSASPPFTTGACR